MKRFYSAPLSACILFLMFSLQGFSSYSQGVSAMAFADTTTIHIGDQFTLNLQLTVPSSHKIKLPVFSDTLNGFEISSKSKIDTVDNKNNTLTYKQQLQLTSFDSGYYVIQPVTFYYKDVKSSTFDSAQTEALLMTVNTVPVDTTRSIKDIKPPVDLPLTFREILPYILIGLALVVAGYFIYRLLKSKKKITEVILPKPKPVPAHEIALKALKELAEKKLWQQGLFKHYHTEVTDIIRAYIENRYQIRAMEETTEEILQKFQDNLANEESKEKLGYILRLADMVKFAKGQPVGSENENSLVYARDFVLLTKPATPEDFREKEVKA